MLNEPSATLPSLRQLKAARCIAEAGSLSAAARRLNRTQSALTKALAGLEGRLGAKLFDRSARGMTATELGRALVERVREAEAELLRAESAYQAFGRPASQRRDNPVFHFEVSEKRLTAFLAVHDSRDVGVAAQQLGHTPAAVYASLRQLERLLDVVLFEHTAAGVTPTAFADVLATHTKLAFSLIRHGVEELASADGVVRGSVVIGTLPYSRTLLTPRTIIRLLEAHPHLRIATREGPYRVLETALRNGELDLIIGAIRPPEASLALITEPLFEDELAVIAGAHHPLVKARSLDLAELLGYGWVLPVRHTPARQLFDRMLHRAGYDAPQQVIETSSMALVRGLLLESQRLALLSRHQAYHDERAGLLTALPIHLEGTYRPIGITQRAHTSPSPAAAAFIETLRRMVATVERPVAMPRRGADPEPSATR